MFTLRIIEETREDKTKPFEQVTENFELGDAYTRIKKGNREFDKIVDEMFPESKDDMLIKSIICGENQKQFFIMENEENKVYHYFIMSDSGKTFEKL